MIFRKQIVVIYRLKRRSESKVQCSMVNLLWILGKGINQFDLTRVFY